MALAMNIRMHILLNKLADIRQEVPNSNLELFVTLSDAGNMFHDAGSHRMALDFFRECLAVGLEYYGDQAESEAAVGQAYNDVGVLLTKHAQYEVAAEHLCRALEIYNQAFGALAAEDAMAATYNNLGILRRLECKYEVAHLHHTKAQELLQTIHGNQVSPLRFITLASVADLFSQQSYYREALDYYDDATKMFETLYPFQGGMTVPSAIRSRYIEVCGKKGELLAQQGSIQEAGKQYESAVAMVSWLDNANGQGLAMAEIYTWMGDFFLCTSQYDQACESFNKALTRISDQDLEGLLRNDIRQGHICTKRLNLDYAKGHYENALALASAVYNEVHPETGNIYIYIGHTLRLHGNYTNAMVYYLKALGIYKQCYAQNDFHSDIASAYSAIAALYRDLGDYDSSHEYNFMSLKINKVINSCNLNHLSIAYDYENIGMTFLDQHEYRQASEYLGKMWPIMLKVYEGIEENLDLIRGGYDAILILCKRQDYAKVQSVEEAFCLMLENMQPPNAVTCKFLNDLGDLDLAHRHYEEATTYYGKALDSCNEFRRQGNPQDLEDVRAWLGLSNVLFECFDYKIASEHCKSAGKIVNKAFGDQNSHPQLANIAKQHGDIYYELGQYFKARDCYDIALEIRETVYKEFRNHPDIADVFHCLGYTYLRLGQYDKCRIHHCRALNIRKALYPGMNHIDLAQSYDGVGAAHQLKGEHDKALQYLQKSLKMKQNCFGKDANVRCIAESYILLGNLSDSQHKYKEAIEYHTKALETSEGIVECDSSKIFTANCHDNIGIANCHKGEWFLALGALRKALELKEGIIDITQSQMPSTTLTPLESVTWREIARTYCYMGDVHHYNGSSIHHCGPNDDVRHEKYCDAIDDYDKALAVLAIVCGNTNSLDVAAVHSQKGIVLKKDPYKSKDDYQSALDSQNRALAIRENLLQAQVENHHPEIAASYKNIGDLHILRGEFTPALVSLNTAYEKYTSVYGIECKRSEMADVYESLGTLYYEQAEHLQALEYYLFSRNIRVAIYGEFEKYNSELFSIYMHLSRVYKQLDRTKESDKNFAIAERIRIPSATTKH